MADGLRWSGYWLWTAYSFKPANKGAEEQTRASPLWHPGPSLSAVSPPGRGTLISDPGTKAPKGKSGPSPPGWCNPCCMQGVPCRDPWFSWYEGPYSPHVVILFPMLRLLLYSVPSAFSLRGGCPNTCTYLVLITNSDKLHGNSNELIHSLST